MVLPVRDTSVNKTRLHFTKHAKRVSETETQASQRKSDSREHIKEQGQGKTVKDRGKSIDPRAQSTNEHLPISRSMPSLATRLNTMWRLDDVHGAGTPKACPSSSVKKNAIASVNTARLCPVSHFYEFWHEIGWMLWIRSFRGAGQDVPARLEGSWSALSANQSTALGQCLECFLGQAIQS